MAVTLKKMTRKFRAGDKAAKVTAKLQSYSNDEGTRNTITTEVLSSDGVTVYKPRISFSSRKDPTVKSYCKVSCQCQDFLYTFAYANHEHGALSGKPPKLRDVKGKGLRAPRNPERLPGVCTHIRGLIEKAIKNQLIQKV